LNLILLSQEDLNASSSRAVITGRQYKHVREFLKPAIGSELCVGLENGKIGTGRVVAIDDGSIEMKLSLHEDPPPPVEGTLILAMPRPLVFNRLLGHVTALGIKSIILMHSKRVEKSYWNSPVLKEENVKAQLVLGLEQAKDTIVPGVSRRMRFKPFVEDELPDIVKGTSAFVAHPIDSTSPLPCDVKGAFTLVMGPEGGFLPLEVSALKRAGCKCVNLGSRILRVETAVVAALGRIKRIRELCAKKTLFFTAIVLVSLIASGCATIRHQVPLDLIDKARVDDMPEARIIVGESNTMLQKNLLLSIKQENAEDFPRGLKGIKVYPMLSISGGGANGAYGAGLLKGWSEEGSRPEFKVVTGVSTGSLIAIFAFLGEEYDSELEDCYTTMSTKDVMMPKWPLAVLFGNSLASNKPLVRTIASIVDEKLLADVALEHKTGRRLFVGTANIDAQRFVIWDMGAIACKGDLELFRKVIIASSAMPVIFPPSVFHVKANGNLYDEMHVDGGTVTQVFTTYRLLDSMKRAASDLGIDPSNIKAKLYIIRNGYMLPTYKEIKDNLPSLAERSFDTIINSQSLGDVYRIYVFMKQRGSDYNLAFIPASFKQNNKEMFDPLEMKRLFDRGYNDAVKGYKWHKAPPGLEGDLKETTKAISVPS